MTDTNTTDIDIRASADRVVALLQQHRNREAMQLLAREREGERTVVQEALDRYVVAGSQRELAALRRPGAVPAADVATVNPALERLEAAQGAPRHPIVEVDSNGGPRRNGIDELAGLSSSQRYDIYASVVAVRGTQAARDALDNGDRVILGLRRENSTLASMDDPRTAGVDESRNASGKGVYDDRLVVLWKDANGIGHTHESHRANTEPTAIYDHHAGSNGHRPYAHGGFDSRQRAASPGFEAVRAPRKIEGDDVNGDGLRDLGRMAEGTYEMERTTHAWPGRSGVTSFSLRPTQAAVRNGQQQVERDSNADGSFTAEDLNGRQPLNQSFKIHLGSRGSTDSAGCQTVHVDEGPAFIAAAQGRPGQTHWQYVLVSTAPGLARQQQPVMPDARRDGPGEPAHRPRMQPDANGHPPQHRAPAHGAPLGHADALLFDAIQRQLPPGTSLEQTAHVLVKSKENGIRDLHQLDRVAVSGNQAWVVGTTPGFWAKVDLASPAPPLQESLRALESDDMQMQRMAQTAPRMSGPALG